MIQSSAHFAPFNAISLPKRLRDVDDPCREFQLAPVAGDGNVRPTIKINISENEYSYYIKAELIGLKKEDIRIEINNNQVSIMTDATGEHAGNEVGMPSHDEHYFSKEHHKFILASDINEAHIVAKYQDGILDLTLPKKPGGCGKQITVI
ncbi:Hsp20/alpha crystallin family protein [Actimicrobium sp. CCC2.4]|uniref:Hsp20/alpha crystallin family protein n=1 Tax=Actimicrobium sp. CCC2.4 TaxID=3048606 RepID=UPI002AC9669C|nr:Hsp20/alpha crystallin family protein [Actimicrobium sp. CCC2.4]MEB0136527.1 Hsp20/alpha crystallin family protein [Actimicrobium sp. CCC2.4]WPX30886.1 Hsp20/alpha crystallin family protein [Actimicrobium sp. CCC2.4]